MKKYFLFIILFGLFFPIAHKLALTVMMSYYKDDAYALVSYYHEYGLLSIRNLIISLAAGVITYFFTNQFIKWENAKRK
jgi:hypothetical protein